ncbi:MAG TPA: transposase, partial [Vicinamibacterales bacterium]|nr:transposase [Vicinamibacterales bacterium]
EELRVIEDHLGQLDQQMADLLAEHHTAVQRLAEVPGLGVDSAQQIIAEVGATAATFPSPKHLASWMGACPGNEESAGVNYSHRCPKGNRQMRRVLNQAAKCRGESQGYDLRRRVSPARPPARPCPGHRRDHPPPVSTDLEDSAPADSL